MGLIEKGDFESTPKIPENYYMASLEDIRDYEREDSEARGLIIEFDIDHDDESHIIPFFAPAKLSLSTERESSRLAENLDKIGLLDEVLTSLDVREEVRSEAHKWVAETEQEAEVLKAAVFDVLDDKDIRVNVQDQQDGESSQVSSLSKVWDEDDGE